MDPGSTKKINQNYKNIILFLKIRAGEPANFLASPAPDFFPKWLRLLVFFFERLRLQDAKKKRLRPLTIG